MTLVSSMKYLVFFFFVTLMIGCSQNSSIKQRTHFDSELDSILYDYRVYYSLENIRRYPSDSVEYASDAVLNNKFYFIIALYQWESKSRMCVWGQHTEYYTLDGQPDFWYGDNLDTVLVYRTTHNEPDSLYANLFGHKNTYNGDSFHCSYVVLGKPFRKEYEFDGTHWILVDKGRDIGKWYQAELKEKFENYNHEFDSLKYLIEQQPNNPSINSYIFYLLLKNTGFFVQALHEHPEIKKRVLLEVSNPKCDSIDIKSCIRRLENAFSRVKEEKELIDALKVLH